MGGFHEIFETEIGLLHFPSGARLNKQQAIDVLRSSFRKMKWSDDTSMDDVGKVAEMWIQANVP